MKRKFLLFLVSMLPLFSVLAQTNVSGTINNNITWTSSNSPYVVSGNITVDAGVTLTIENGTEVRFNSGTYIQVYGTLNANGVTFTANSSSTPGFWAGIYVGYEYGSDYGSVTLDGCSVEYAKSLYVRMGDLTLTNNTSLNNFSNSGLDIYTAGTVSIDHTVIQNCNYPVYFRGNGNWTVGEGVSLTGNTNDYVFIDFRDITSVFNCQDAGVPYYFDSELRVTETGTLIASAGTEFNGNTNAYINVYGKIKALGTVADSVVFTKTSSSTYWQGINIYDTANDTACIFNYTKFTNAEYNTTYRPYAIDYCAVSIDKSSPVFNNCVFADNNFNLVVTGRSFPEFTDCSFKTSKIVTHQVANVNVDMNAEPVFNNCDIAFNEQEGRAIGVIGSTVYDDSHFKQLSFNGYPSLPFALFGNVTVQDTASLTLDPGTVIKCADNDYYINANGVLNAVGTATNPIVFTHINDDSFGNPGDTYNDGTSTINKSSSGRLFLRSTGTSHVEYWTIKYGGYSSDYYAVEVRNGNVLKNCNISDSHRGVLFMDNAQLLNNSFEDIEYYPVTRRMNAGTPSLIGNTISNVGYNGIAVNGFDSGDYSIGGLDFAGNTNTAYIIPNKEITIPEDANVTVLPGTVFKFSDYYSSSRLTVRGGLKAEGTSSNRIIFTSIYDNSVSGNTNYNSGDDPTNHKWGRVQFLDSSNDTFNSLKYIDIRYFRESVLIDHCNVAVDNAILNFSSSYGMSIYGTAAPVISNCEFNNLSLAPIQMDMFANPVFSGNSMANVGKAGISIHGGTVAGTVPARNFAGYTNITYLLDENIRVDGQLTIPAGIIFKGDGNKYIEVYGKLTVQGTASNPVVFTSVDDDAYGNPLDTKLNGNTTPAKNGCNIVFRESADDASVVDNAVFRYMYNHGVYMMDASPTISNCTFFEPLNEAIMLRGSSAPTITGCTFENAGYPMTIDPTAYPAFVSGNQLTGTTIKAIRIVDNATLTQDATLNRHTFAGIDNIPYVFYRYTIGTSAVLTIEPGVVCKFKDSGYLNVRKGLIANGGSTTDSTIVFTSDLDDFYGGDTYGDGDATSGNDNSWWGIYFPGESIDASCSLNNCVIKNASRTYTTGTNSNNRGAVTLNNSSPTIKNTLFENDRWGILARNTSVPVIDSCDFVGIDDATAYGIWNETGTVTITAENCWWNDVSGPYNASSNPDGKGARVSDKVDFDPWISQPAQPMMGDVSMNGEVMPYDASLVLQSTVGNITLNAKQQDVADVSYNGSITSYDASLILQYTVGTISSFELAAGAAALKSASLAGDVQVSVPYETLEPESDIFEIPVTFTTTGDVKAMDIKITSNPDHVRFLELNTSDLPSDVMISSGYDETTGTIKISVASSANLDFNANDMVLKFEFSNVGHSDSEVKLVNLLANESSDDDTFTVQVGSNQVATKINDAAGDNDVKLFFDGSKIVADITVANTTGAVTVAVFDLTGRMTNRIDIKDVVAGQNRVKILPYAHGAGVRHGIYIVKITGAGLNVTRKLVVK